MKACKEWWDNRGPPGGPYVLAHQDAFEEWSKYGWRAALEWVKREAIALDERGDANRTVINRELGEVT